MSKSDLQLPIIGKVIETYSILLFPFSNNVGEFYNTKHRDGYSQKTHG